MTNNSLLLAMNTKNRAELLEKCFYELSEKKMIIKAEKILNWLMQESGVEKYNISKGE